MLLSSPMLQSTRTDSTTVPNFYLIRGMIFIMHILPVRALWEKLDTSMQGRLANGIRMRIGLKASRDTLTCLTNKTIWRHFGKRNGATEILVLLCVQLNPFASQLSLNLAPYDVTRIYQSQSTNYMV